jgi:phosphopantothenoylcysteine synthetase/decarboxylase
MNTLVTAGNTQAPIDKVRCLTNIFSGRTGAGIALEAHRRGHEVTLLTSHPEVIPELGAGAHLAMRWHLFPYRTFDELHALMREKIAGRPLDAVVHCAAVSDYLAAGIYAPAPGTRFFERSGRWQADAGTPALIDRRAGKVKSDDPELWLRLARAPKLVDSIRTDWCFVGVLVKFKLEVGATDEQLLQAAEPSRTQSGADLMVANTLEGAGTYAFLGPRDRQYQRVERDDLAARLLDAVAQIHQGRRHG